MTPEQVTIRLRQVRDEAAANALWNSVGAYRPEDAADVRAMYERANQAKAQADPRWIALPSKFDRTQRVGWVAVTQVDSDLEQVVGIVDLADANGILEMPSEMRSALKWDFRDYVAEIIRISVRPEYWRRGVGSKLMAAAIERARHDGYRLLLIKTTAPQVPAQNLFRKLGFSEVARSFLDKYEMLWFEMPL